MFARSGDDVLDCEERSGGRKERSYLCELLCFGEGLVDFGREVLVGLDDRAVRHGGGLLLRSWRGWQSLWVRVDGDVDVP